ncbi:MarR family winged helix-turn-helix transcriptional regulator [Cytobacillus kochii]|uniref:MarR family winged helix-turn-helix transcriptional regulator n=1 Tax=Cytobacillus kochii TaxID=859143 RepID=UPI001CD1B536|nr:MarR family transcriptional regulator [Cytobacillus kochii]MCA1027405.1 MarR family transcriptional regulator [Cytobacillus kochii]MCM3322084.1 MarR family transcriptional regulator [Cytobacillus kochii]MCM3343084.1 MarR family transcriptional regulator [Cytobacillus kochii]MDM5206914.1 MarR family transcriptional regulator [Cytobacillus kochii]
MHPEESTVIQKISKKTTIEPNAIAVVTSLYRIGQGIKNKLEQEVLAKHKISWTSFSILYDLWIYGKMETKELALSAGVSKATISNIMRTLENKSFCRRETDPRDRRNTFVVITPKGKEVIEELYPEFHEGEISIVNGLKTDDQKQLAATLYRLIKDNKF